MDTPEHIAVYGSLRKDLGPNGMYHLLESEKATEFQEYGQVAGNMLNLGAFPGLVDFKDGDTSLVEIHKIKKGKAKELLRRLDRYEGYQEKNEEHSLFIRRAVKLVKPKDFLVWVYLYNTVPEKKASLVLSKDWYMTRTGRRTPV